VAEAMGYRYLDTGAMYRGIAYAYRLDAPEDLQAFLDRVPLRFSFEGATRVFLGEEEISDRVRTPEIALLASSLSQDTRVRNVLTRMQRAMGKEGGVVVEGRDTGSVVFPNAEVKFYLDADLGERAKRRLLEQVARNEESDPEKVKKDMERRDRDDSERAIAPLIRPEGAIYVDTTGKGVEEVVEIVRRHVEQAAGECAE
jgi:cytidylate kinase